MGIEPRSSGRTESLTGLALTEWDRLAHGVKTLQLAVIKYGNVLNHKPHSVMAHQTHPTVGRGRGGARGVLPLLEKLLTSFLQGQHLGEGLVTFQVLLRNGAIFGDIFQKGIVLKIETENRI